MMIRTTAYFLSCFLLVSLALPPSSSQAQDPKKGGIFKFGKKEEGISSGLFPDKKSKEKKWVPGKEGENMFIKPVNTEAKKATPKPKPVAQKVSPPVAKPSTESKKKGGFFSFGKKSPKSSSDATITPVPEKVRPRYPKPTNHSMSMSEERPVAIPTKTPPNAEKEKSSGGLFSFFPGKKKNPNTESDLKAIASSTKYQGVTEMRTHTVEQMKTPSKPVSPAPKPVTSGDQLVAQTVTTVKDQTKKEKHKIGFPKLSMPSLPKIKRSGKKTDYTSVETVMKDGSFVEKTNSETTLSNAPATSNPSGQKRPPTVVNGVKTYSSWDDVESKSSSAADKILRQLR